MFLPALPGGPRMRLARRIRLLGSPPVLPGVVGTVGGATTRALRYYEQRGLLGSGRGPNGYRDYGPEAVVWVHNIRRLLEAGLSCDDIREVDACLDRDLDHEPACQDAIVLYEQRLDTIRRRIDALLDVHRSLRRELEHLRSPREPGSR